MTQDPERLIGTHSTLEALRAGRRKFLALYLAPRAGARASALRELAEKAGVPCHEMSSEELDRRAGDTRHQGVLLEASPIPEYDLDGLFAGSSPGLILATDGVEDPQNFGALLRVADAAGVTGVLTTQRRAPPLSSAVARASAGALEHVPVARVTNLSQGLRRCREAGFWLVAASGDAGRSLYDPVFEGLWRESLVLVLGSEGRGIRPGIGKLVDEQVQIPMGGQVASLNVSTAGAVLLFEIQRVRLGAKSTTR